MYRNGALRYGLFDPYHNKGIDKAQGATHAHDTN
jgi:hypothetical protein